MKNIFLLFILFSILSSCDNISDEDEMRIQIEKVTSEMKVSTMPESLVFDKHDSIPIVLNCSYKDSAFCCGGGEIRFVIDDTLDFDRIYTDSMYSYTYCGCGDTIYLKELTVGEHNINGNLSWNAGDWTYGKNWERKIQIK